MKNCKVTLALIATICALPCCPTDTRSQEKSAPATAEVHLVITDAALREDSEYRCHQCERDQPALQRHRLPHLLGGPGSGRAQRLGQANGSGRTD